jgi:TonB family protein
MIARLWPWIFIFSLSAAASVQPISAHLTRASLSQREYQLWRTPARSTEFSEVPHVSARARCEDTTQPEALTTPNPLLVPPSMGAKIKVSFIIGADGRVHSPLILESAGSTGDRNVLQTVRNWRYRPATCNGVPTEAEGKIEFSHR